MEGDFPVIKKNRQVVRLMIKNLIKNAIEANAETMENKSILLKMADDKTLEILNTLIKGAKINLKKIFNAGFSQKTNLSNRGLGLYIVSELAYKNNIKMNVTQTKEKFIFKLSFYVE